MSQRADAKTVGLFVDGPAVLAGVQGESELEQHLHAVCGVRERLETVTGVGSVTVSDVLERRLAFVTGFGSVMVGVLERGCAFGTGFGAKMTGVSFVFAVGVGATTSAASSLVAALSVKRFISRG